MFVKQDGSVWSTGVDSVALSEGVVKVIPAGATAAAAGNGYSIAFMQDGSVWTTGKKSGRDSFSDGLTMSRRTFSFVQVIPGARVVAAGGYHSMVLTQENDVWATGWNKYGQLGDGSTQDRTTFIRAILDGAKAVSAGDIHSVVLKEDGNVWAAGSNSYGQLGDGSKEDRSSFVQIMSSGAVYVAAGGYHSLALKDDGSVWATGWNRYGQLGDRSTLGSVRLRYVQVVSSGARAAAAGSRHSMVLKQDGSVWTTGYNLYGQLGDGSTITRETFVQVIPIGATKVAAGGFHSMMVKQDGSIWTAGSNEYGQFGDGAMTSAQTFVRASRFHYG